MSAETTKNEADLIRKDLDTISLEEIRGFEKIKLTPDQIKERAGDIELFYDKWGRDLILEIYWEQLKKIAHTEGDPKFKQGVIDGIVLIKELLEQESGISKSRFDKPEEEPELGDI